MGAESHAKASLIYGILLPRAKLVELWKRSKQPKEEEEEDVIKGLIWRSMTEGDGLALETFTSHGYWGQEEIVYVITAEDSPRLEANASDSKVGVKMLPDSLPDILIKKESLESFFQHLDIKKPKDTSPKWMMICDCQLLE